MPAAQWVRRIAGGLVFSGCLAAPSVPAPARATCAPSAFRQRKPLVIAHASSTHFGPGNTLPMLRAAVKAGADVVDADVRVTADGVLVAAHDDSLRGLTKTSGSVSTMTYAELLRFDLGDSWPGPAGDFPLKGKRVRVPTIEQILTAFPNRLTSLEFKVTGGEKTMCTLLRRLNRTKNVYIGSAGDAPVNNFKPLCPEVTTTVTDALVDEMRAARDNPDSTWCSPVPIGQPPYRRERFTKDFVDWNHDRGLAIFTWTVDDPHTLERLAVAGVDAVYTGRADLARKIFDRIATTRPTTSPTTPPTSSRPRTRTS